MRILLSTHFLFGLAFLSALAQANEEFVHFKPQIFLPGVVSKENRFEFGFTLSAKNDELYYGVELGHRTEIHQSLYKDGKWTEGEPIIVDDRYHYHDLMLNLEENRLYFISDRPISGEGTPKDFYIWYVEREDHTWSKPVWFDTGVNTDKGEYYVSFANNGDFYFSRHLSSPANRPRNFEIYRASENANLTPDIQALDNSVNGPYYEADPFIAPDGSYIIFASVRRGGLGQGDLYISFKNDNGSWSKAISLGETVNDSGNQFCPFVSRDGKTFFYTSNQDIYSIDAEWLQTFKAKLDEP